MTIIEFFLIWLAIAIAIGLIGLGYLFFVHRWFWERFEWVKRQDSYIVCGIVILFSSPSIVLFLTAIKLVIYCYMYDIKI